MKKPDMGRNIMKRELCAEKDESRRVVAVERTRHKNAHIYVSYRNPSDEVFEANIPSIFDAARK